MSLTLRSNATGALNASSGSVTTSSGVTVSAGDLIVVTVEDNHTDVTPSAISDSAGNTYTLRTVQVKASSKLLIGYCLAATTGGASVTFTGDFTGTGYANRRICAAVFNPSGATVTLDSSAAGTGYGTSPASGTLSTTGTDEVVIAGVTSHSSQAQSSQAIGGSAATVLYPASADYLGLFYRILTATASNISASATLAANAHWTVDFCAFKATAAAGISGAGGISSGAGYGTAKVSGQVQASGVGSGEAFGTTALRGILSAAGAIVSVGGLGSPALAGAIKSAGAIAGTAALGSPALIAAIEAVGAIASAEGVGSPALKGLIAAAGAIASGAAVGNLCLGGHVALAGIEAGSALGTPEISAPAPESISEVGTIVPSSALGLPSIGGGLSGIGAIAPTLAMGSPSVGGRIAGVGDISPSALMGAAQLAAIVRASAIMSGAAIGSPALVENGVIKDAGGIASGLALGAPSLWRLLPALAHTAGGPRLAHTRAGQLAHSGGSGRLAHATGGDRLAHTGRASSAATKIREN